MASHLAQRSTSPFDAPRYLIYRAMDLSNRGAFDRALRLVLAANKRYAVLIKAEVAAADLDDGTARQRLDPILFEFAHGLYVHAGISRQVGQMDEAARSVRLAKDVSARTDGVPQGFLENLDNVLKARPVLRQQLGQQPEEEMNFE